MFAEEIPNIRRRYHKSFEDEVPSLLDAFPLAKDWFGSKLLGKIKLTPYFSEPFNWADFLSCFILHPLLIGIRVQTLLIQSEVLQPSTTAAAVNLGKVFYLGWLQHNMVYTLAATNFISWLKLFDYLRVFPNVGKRSHQQTCSRNCQSTL